MHAKLDDRLLDRIGRFILRYSLVFFFIAFGLYKFTPQEAAGVAPLMAHSPVLFWAKPLLGERGASAMIGVIEVTIGLLIALRRFRPDPVGDRQPGGVVRAADDGQLPVHHARPQCAKQRCRVPAEGPDATRGGFMVSGRSAYRRADGAGDWRKCPNPHDLNSPAKLGSDDGDY